jgi:hypothetical protein
MSTIKIAFVNPPHADWSLANNAAYLMFQSHYQRHGKYPNDVEWIPAPYRFNSYKSIEEIYEDIKSADIYLFSSYFWNYQLVDELAEYVKKNHPEAICVLGGPHIGTYDPKFLSKRTVYDFILRPTKPGEIFVQDLIDSYIKNNGKLKINQLTWELRSIKTCPQFIPDYSVYEEHFEYLKETRDYCRKNKLEPFMILETTRGCPYQCSFCEWGGGIGSKIYKKPIEIVKKDILTLKAAGYEEAFLTDANFGVFFERDLEIYKFSWENGVRLTDISSVKSKDLDRRVKLVDACFEIVGENVKKKSNNSHLDKNGNVLYSNIVPTVSIQSVSDLAMKVANRVDLSFDNKIKLSKHIYKRCHEQKYPIPTIELILGMPGSTLDDFYKEFNILWNFKAWDSQRHDYMFLPDSEISNPEYLKKYNIDLVEVFVDVVDDSGVDNFRSLYRNNRSYFKTVSSCFSFTRNDICEMWVMNLSGSYLLRKFYHVFEEDIDASEFGKICFQIIKSLDGFQEIWDEIEDILNPITPPKNIKRINGNLRIAAVEEFLEKNSNIIFSEAFKIINVKKDGTNN